MNNFVQKLWRCIFNQEIAVFTVGREKLLLVSSHLQFILFWENLLQLLKISTLSLIEHQLQSMLKYGIRIVAEINWFFSCERNIEIALQFFLQYGSLKALIVLLRRIDYYRHVSKRTVFTKNTFKWDICAIYNRFFSYFLCLWFNLQLLLVFFCNSHLFGKLQLLFGFLLLQSLFLSQFLQSLLLLFSKNFLKL